MDAPAHMLLLLPRRRRSHPAATPASPRSRVPPEPPRRQQAAPRSHVRRPPTTAGTGLLRAPPLAPQVVDRAWQGEYQFVYVTPELATSQTDRLQQLHATRGIALVAIDEAHCVSEWG